MTQTLQAPETIDMAVARLRDHLANEDRARRTIEQYTRGFKRLYEVVCEALGERIDPNTLTPRDVARARDAMLERGGGAGANWLVTSARAWARATGREREFSKVRTVRRGWRPGPSLAPQEYNRLMRALDRAVHEEAAVPVAKGDPLALTRHMAVRDSAAIALLVGSALRRAEAVSVLVGDVRISRTAGWVDVRAGKGLKQRSTPIPLGHRDRLQAQIEAIYRESEGLGIAPDDIRRRPLLATARRVGDSTVIRPLSVSGLEKRVQHWSEAADIDPRHRGCHALRRYRAICWRWRDKLPIEVVSNYLGHESIEVTRIYTTPEDPTLWGGAPDSHLTVVMERD